MEEKERYINLSDRQVKDTQNNSQGFMSINSICKTLNQQDKDLSKLRASYQQVKEENQQLIKALNGEVFINYKLPMENAQLKQQLAESEKNFIIANNLRKNSNEVLLNYKTEKYGLDKTIQELRKIKLSFPEKEWYYKGFENCERQMSSHIADLTLEVKQLKQQLHELPKKIVGEVEKNFTEYLPLKYKTGAGFYLRLNTILKMYGGEDE